MSTTSTHTGVILGAENYRRALEVSAWWAASAAADALACDLEYITLPGVLHAAEIIRHYDGFIGMAGDRTHLRPLTAAQLGFLTEGCRRVIEHTDDQEREACLYADDCDMAAMDWLRYQRTVAQMLLDHLEAGTNDDDHS